LTEPFDIVILGLSITSSWGNGHATTYRSLVRGLAARGHRILFLERDAPWYADNRDAPHPEGVIVGIYADFSDLTLRFEKCVRDAGVVVVGSFVPEGAEIGEWVVSTSRGHTAFYDIDTPVTLERLESGLQDYITPALVSRYQTYFSFTGGPALRHIESHYGSPMARPLYCSVDPEKYHPCQEYFRWDLGYLGTYSADRQPGLESLLAEPARRWPGGRFAVVGAMYPEELSWPENVYRNIHLSPHQHAKFYSAQRFTLNITRQEMKKWGYSPSVRLFEAAACGIPIISDWWTGLDDFFEIGREILIARDPDDTLRFLRDTPEDRRRAIGARARERVLAEHTAAHRARQFENYLRELDDKALSGAPRRNGYGRQLAGGFEVRDSSQRKRKETGGEAGAVAQRISDLGGLFEPGRARVRDSQLDCAAPETRTSSGT
jgi:spore maturation protein CgeB